jgi:CBS domain-containing protein
MIRLQQTVTVETAVQEMRERRRGSVVVVDENGTLRGIFTERDVLLQGGDNSTEWLQRTLAEAMTTDPNRVFAGDSVNDALQAMEEGGFRHLPVVDEEDRPVAIISIRDVLAYVVEHFPQEFINLPPSPSLEANKPWGG